MILWCDEHKHHACLPVVGVRELLEEAREEAFRAWIHCGEGLQFLLHLPELRGAEIDPCQQHYLDRKAVVITDEEVREGWRSQGRRLRCGEIRERATGRVLGECCRFSDGRWVVVALAEGAHLDVLKPYSSREDVVRLKDYVARMGEDPVTEWKG